MNYFWKVSYKYNPNNKATNFEYSVLNHSKGEY